MEEIIICHALSLFLFEKLYSYCSQLKIAEDKMKMDIRVIMSNIFGKSVLKESE